MSVNCFNPMPDSIIMKSLKCLFADFCLAIGCAAAAGSVHPSIEVQHGWVRWLPGALPAAGYLTIINHGATASALVKASSPDYGDVMLHRTVTSGGMENMEMVDRLKIPAHGEIDLSPGNYHLMLMHAKHPVAPGDEVPVVLQFSDGTAVHARLKVRPANQLN